MSKAFRPLGTLVHGAAATEHLDSTGERISIKGIDISSLTVDGLLNYEHKNDQPSQIVGKILKAKKIFTEEDCATKEEKYFWEKCNAPFVYIIGELFDLMGHEGAKQVASMFKYDTQARMEGRESRNVVSFSIEGSKLGKDGQKIESSLARKVTITGLPANKMAIAEELVLETAPGDDIKKSEDEDGEGVMQKDAKVLKMPALPSSTKIKSPGKKLPWWASTPGDVSAFKEQKSKLQVEDRRKKMNPKMTMPGVEPKKLSIPQEGPTSLKPNKVFKPEVSGKIDYKGIKKAITAGSGMGSPDTKVQGDALSSSSIEKELHKLPQFSKFLKAIETKYPSMTKNESEAMAKYMTARSMMKAEEAMEKISVNPKLISDKVTHIHPKHGPVKSIKSYETDKGKAHTLEIMTGEHKGKWTNALESELDKTSDMDKSKNVRKQRAKIFGTDANAPRTSDRRQKMMQQIRGFAEKRFGMPFVTAEGKRDESGKLRQDKDNQPAYDVFTPKGVAKEKRLLADYKKKGIKRTDPKPDWRSGRLETQPSPDAAIHEAAHLYLAPEGMTPALFQEEMDQKWGESQSKYGHMQQKRTSGEIQPMSVENPIRREMGLPANRTTKPVKENERALDYEGDRFVQGKDSKGRDAFYDRQSRLMTPENRERVEQVREGSLKFHPEKGWYKDSGPDSLINLRGRGKPEEAKSRAQERYSQQSAPKKMAASELAKKSSMYKRCWEGYKPVPGKKPYSKGSCEPMNKNEEKGKYITVSQSWRDQRFNKETGKFHNPVTESGKKMLTHMNDIHALDAAGIRHYSQHHDKPVKSHGNETYKVHPDGKLTHVHSSYDSSD